jgi:hypothetical protein
VKKGQYLFDLKINLANLQKEIGDEYVILLRTNKYCPFFTNSSSLQVGAYMITFLSAGKFKSRLILFDLKINLANLQKEIGDEYVILLRMHYLIANALPKCRYNLIHQLQSHHIHVNLKH